MTTATKRMQGGKKKVATAARSTARWVYLTSAVCLILLALLLLLARVGLPWLGTYKGEVEARLSEQLKSPVVIDDLSVRWEHFGPTLSATGVSLSESADRQVTLDEVLIDVNMLKSISQGTPIIDELTLVGVKLALETDNNGNFQLHGLKQSAPTSEKPKKGIDVLSWLMDTSRVGLQDAIITLTSAEDEEELVITDLNILATNDGDLHQLRVDMQLPEELGGQVEIGLDLVGQSVDIRNASADLHVTASNLKPDGWRTLQASRFKGLPISTTGIARLDATVQMELWGTVSDGRLQTARGQLAVADVIDIKSQQPVLDNVSTDIVFEDLPLGWKLSADSLELQDGGETTSVNNVVYQFKPTENTAWQLDANGESLELDLATRLALSLFDKDADLPRAKWLAEASPRGDLYDWDASFALVDGRPDFSLFSIFHELNLTAAGGIPGASNIGGTIDMKHNVGKIAMQGVDMALDLPSAYAQPLQLQKLYGELYIDVQDPLRTSLKGEVVIDDQGFDATTRLEVKLDPGASPHIDLQSKFSLNDIGQANRYVPTRLLRPPTTRWLNRALIAGEAVNGELLMFGNVSDFPFAQNEGVFKVGFDMKNTTIDYLDGWPQTTDLQGRFDMEGASIRTVANDGKLQSMRISKLDVRINDLLNPVLEVSTTGADSLARIIQFGKTGPLKGLLKSALTGIDATGRAQMDVNLTLPLKRKAEFNTVASAQKRVNKTSTSIAGLKVNGSVFLKNNDITYDVAKLALEKVDGAVGFTQDGIRVNNLQGLMYGRPVRVDSKTEGRGSKRVTEFTVEGPMSAEKVLENYGIPLTRFAKGESHWNVSVKVPMNAAATARNGIQLAAVSDLVGTRLILPEPLGKSVGQGQRMGLSSIIFPQSENREWLIDYGNFMRALVRVDEDGLQSMSTKFGGGSPNENVETGFRFEGVVSELSLDGWAQSISELIDDLPASNTPTPIMPISGDLQVKQFVAGNQGVGGGSLRFNTDHDYINGVIDSQWLSGNARYPREHWTQTRAAVARINLIDKRFIDALETADKKVGGGELDPRTLPPIEARVAQIRWDALDLKGLTIRTSPSVSGLNIDTFGFAYDSAQLVGTGYWRLRDPQNVNNELKDQHITKLDLMVQSNDFGQIATELGFAGTLDEGEGVLTGSLVWPAPAYKPSLENLGGEVDIDIKKGRILKVEPGAAKLVGLFALQSIPRRLSLDFKDLVLDGLDYETIRGEVQLANGIAHAPLVQLNGSVGVIDITGESNLITRQYNQRITVLPRVSAALPIIGIISGGATAGLGVLFAGGFLKAVGVDFDRIGLREYALTGGWDEPAFTLVPYERPGN